MTNKRMVFVLSFLVVIGSVSYLYFGADQPHREQQLTRLRIEDNPLERLLGDPPGTPGKRSLPTDSTDDIDKTLLNTIRERGLTPLQEPKKYKKEKIRLGRWLFWEKELSGNRKLSCGMCHNPTTATTDNLSLAIGPGALGDSVNRSVRSVETFMPRNTLDLFNRGQDEWKNFFWDNRIRKQPDGSFHAPVQNKFIERFDSLLQVQSVFPLVQNDELLGDPGDRDIFGFKNPVANVPEDDFDRIWSIYVDRVVRHDTYVKYFRKSFETVDGPESISIEHVARAMASFIEVGFTLRNSPWDRYLSGATNALSTDEKKGALVFFGEGRCATCHAGNLFTDQEPHNIAVPQLGPGQEPHKPLDLGAYATTGNEDHRFAFRTPPLRNVAVTGPWMHNGAYKSLEGAVRHHLHPEKSLKSYDPYQLGYDIQKYHRSPAWINQLDQFPHVPPGTFLIPTFQKGLGVRKRILKTLDPTLTSPINLSRTQFDNLMKFLFSLTSPSLYEHPYGEKIKQKNSTLIQSDRRRAARMTPWMRSTVPDTTPSGIPVDCLDEWCR